VFITFEGIDGSGKTTQVRLLADKLRSQGYKVLRTAEPGGTGIGLAIRSLLLESIESIDPLTEFLLFSASRAQLLKTAIRPYLEAGGVVIADRFSDSSIAYQGYAGGADVIKLLNISAAIVGSTVPTITFLLDVPLGAGLFRQRLHGNVPDRIEGRGRDYYARVQDGYYAMVAGNPKRWVVIDASQPISAVADAVWSALWLKLEEQ